MPAPLRRVAARPSARRGRTRVKTRAADERFRAGFWPRGPHGRQIAIRVVPEMHVK